MAEFLPAIDYVLREEGAYCNDADDPGGETKYGICKRDHPDVDIKNLSIDEARRIYREQYWEYDLIADQRVATKLLDMAVNMEGTGKAGRAIRIVQEACFNQVAIKTDGIFGPGTLAAINKCDPDKLLHDMCSFAEAHYLKICEHDPRLRKFLNGWRVRANRVPQFGAKQ